MLARTLVAVLSGSLAAPVPLHAIDALPGVPLCANVVVHANAAIDAALHGDAALNAATTALEAGDLSIASPHRAAELDVLANDANASARGRAELSRLRPFADGPGEPARLAALRGFTLALARALDRQKAMADDLSALLSSIAVRQIKGGTDIARPASDYVAPAGAAGRTAAGFASVPNFPQGHEPGDPDLDRSAANGLARAFPQRMEAVRDAERRAGEQSEAAAAGTTCGEKRSPKSLPS